MHCKVWRPQESTAVLEKGGDMITEKIILNEERNVTLTTYLQPVGEEFAHIKARPAIIVIPGGGYDFCSDREAEPIALAYLREEAPTPLKAFGEQKVLEHGGALPERLLVVGAVALADEFEIPFVGQLRDGLCEGALAELDHLLGLREAREPLPCPPVMRIPARHAGLLGQHGRYLADARRRRGGYGRRAEVVRHRRRRGHRRAA